MENIPNLQYGKMCQGLCHLPGGVILKLCLKRSQKPKFQCLVPDGGQMPAWYEAEELISLGACMMPGCLGQPKDAAGCSLWQVLESHVPGKYFLSPRACTGILRRAAQRGKELPYVLKTALEKQAGKHM